MHRLSHAVVLGAACTLTALPRAQRPGFPALAEAIVPIHTAPSDMGTEYGVWGAGPTYKASFHDGATFVPYLGSEYPQNQPLRWRTRSVQIGAHELVTAPATALPYEEGVATRFCYDLGGVREVYDLVPAGLHQTFVIDRGPVGGGDLVVRGTLETQLRAPRRDAEHAALVFSDGDGRAILAYGAAVAVDANGRKASMTTAFEDDEISLHLDAGWLETAAFPVVVDPLLGNVALFATANPPTNGDVVHDGMSGQYDTWFTYSRAASAADEDLWLWRNQNDFGAASVAAFVDVTANWSSSHGRLAPNGATQSVVLAFTRAATNGLMLPSVRWHTHLVADLTMSSVVGWLIPPIGSADWRPAIGGTAPGTAGSRVCIVLQRENHNNQPFANTPQSRLVVAVIDVAGPLPGSLAASASLLGSGSSRDYERPAINRMSSGGSRGYHWVVTSMEHDNVAQDDWDIVCQRVGTDATATGLTRIDPGVARHKMGPTIDGRDGRYLLAFSSDAFGPVAKPTNTFGTWVHTTRLDDTGGALIAHPTRTLFATTAPRLRVTSCAFDADTRSHWLVGYDNAQGADAVVFTVGHTGNLLQAEVLFNGSATAIPGEARVAYDSVARRYVCTATVQQSGNQPVYGNVFSYPTATSPIATAGAGCSPAAIRWTTPFQLSGNPIQLIGNEFTQVEVLGAPSNALHFLLLSTARVDRPILNPVVVPGCRLLVDSGATAFIGILDLRIGANVRWSLPIPEFLSSGVFHFQDWHTDRGGVQFVSTQRLQVPLVK